MPISYPRVIPQIFFLFLLPSINNIPSNTLPFPTQSGAFLSSPILFDSLSVFFFEVNLNVYYYSFIPNSLIFFLLLVIVDACSLLRWCLIPSSCIRNLCLNITWATRAVYATNALLSLSLSLIRFLSLFFWFLVDGAGRRSNQSTK